LTHDNSGDNNGAAVTGRVVYHEYSPEKMVKLLEELRASGGAVAVDSKTGETFHIDKAIEFYSHLCVGFKAVGT